VVVLGIVAFVVALLVSVVLHEAGHFVTARRFGMKATQFFVGFGPTLWSRKRGETEYGIKAIPAGGFVKIVGMTPLEEIDPADEPRAFHRQPAGKKAIVLVAGSVMHFLITIALVFGVTFAIGTIDDTAPVLSSPTQCLPTSVVVGETPPAGCEPGTVPGVAAQAGLQAGDRVVSANGAPVETYVDFVEAVRSSAGTPLELLVERDGERLAVELTPVPVTRPSLDDPNQSVQVGAIGIGQDLVTKRLGPVAAAEESVDRLGLLVTGTWTALTEKLDSITTLYSPDRDREGLVGVVGAARVSGEVLAIDEVPFVVRVADFLLLMAGLNLFVGVFNLLPLLPLDGGHLAVLGYENLRHKLRRLRGYRGELQPVDFTKLLPLTYVVVLLFVGLTVFIMGADIVNPVRLTQ
jgi:membrane-associated protease RseP (regulator of RpoE activity)